MNKLSLLIFFLILANIRVFPQDALNHKLGIYGGINFNNHTADFYKLAGIPNCCPEFRDGTGSGWNGGLLYEMRLGNQFWLGSRLGLITLNGILKNEELTTIITQTGPTTGVFEHKMDGTFTNIGLEPSILYNAFGGLFISGGIRLGLNISSKYAQIETIIKPDGVGTFTDPLGNDSGMRTRNKYSGDIPNSISFQMFATGGISYEFPLNKSTSLRVAPEVQYYFPITELVENTKWKVNSLRFGLALKYVPIPKPPKQKLFERKYEIDTIQIPSDLITQTTSRRGTEQSRQDKFEDDEKIVEYEIISRTDTILTPITYKLSGKITAVSVDNFGNEIPASKFTSVDNFGNEIPASKFTVEEFVPNRLDPLLNYIFFEDNSSQLPERYKKLTPNEAKDFQIGKLFYDSTLQIYHNILNIIGRRMIANPTTTITLIGCNSDQGAEHNNTNLSRQRAEEVKSYLTQVWNIADNRIKIQTRNLPQKPSTEIYEPDKIAENRRVEIISDNEKTTEPIFIEKIDRTANPPIIRFKLQAESEIGLKSWKVIAYQNSDRNNKFEYLREGQIEPQIDWELAQYQKITPKNPEPILVELQLEDKKGNKHTSKTQTEPVEIISIEKKRSNRVGNYEIEQFSLILFDFDKATIEVENKKIVDFIKGRIKPESEIEIIGYTDRTGSPDYNKRLSQRRADATRAALGRADAKSIVVGQERSLYNNDLPEGRFYCRTVEVLVKTKITGE
ncbi:MAG TPA: OmpA family protein [Candidatus Kapabacteria bacterium]|nr:OmpA family protein [Candidatus Kapabacteria bacterium]